LSLPGYHKSDSTVSLDQWNHVAVTVDGSQIKIYINGTLDKTIDSTGDIITNSYYDLGIAATAAVEGVFEDFFHGLIDEVRIYNRALSATEVQEHYQGVFSNETGLVGYWKFDEGGIINCGEDFSKLTITTNCGAASITFEEAPICL
jgi:hypothetical protein